MEIALEIPLNNFDLYFWDEQILRMNNLNGYWFYMVLWIFTFLTQKEFKLIMYFPFKNYLPYPALTSSATTGFSL